MSQDYTGKRVMIIGAGRGQLGLYKAANKMGVTCIAAGYPGKYPGLALADEICNVDISDSQAVVEAARKLNIDAVVTSCMDTGVEAVGAVNDVLGLCGVSFKAASEAFDKVLQKKAFFANDVLTAGAVVATSVNDLSEAEERFGYPLVVKRRHSQGSDGVFIVKTHDAAVEAIESCMIPGEEFLIEEFLVGDEFGAQAFVSHGEIKFVMLHGDLLFTTHAPIPVGHYVPLQQPEEVQRIAEDAVRKAVRASNFDNCAVNVDLCMNKGNVCVVELTGRAGANGLPELVGMYMGTNYYEAIIRNALGEDVSFAPSSQLKAALVKMILPMEDATLGPIDLAPIDKRIIDIWPFIEEGDQTHAFQTLKDCIGQISVEASDIEECIAAANKQARRTFSLPTYE